ncbi:exodeoxyribonuclease III [Candidatus Woesearchaeota archaeon]|nr:exodeoxyribonuclease III [Candidatus Woesearchaeota archaeon]
MKLISWNVNGIRAVLNKGFREFVKKENPDVLCIQETKAHPDQVDKILEDYPHHFWNTAVKKGYSGTAIFSKTKPINITYGIEKDEHDKEGRVITAEFPDFYLVDVYVPNSQRGLTRLKYRLEWNEEFLSYLKKLDKKKPVIFCGDLNVAHKEIDIARPKDNIHNAGFTAEERNDFTRLLDSGFIDAFRELNPNKVQYSWWAYMFNARAKNIGWRIDYFVVSERMKNKIKNAEILDQVHGSDHAPVVLELK